MSHGPQVSPATEFLPGIFQSDSAVSSRSNATPTVACPSVLLVGRNGSWGTTVLKALGKCRSELFYAAPETVTPEYVRKGAYHLILLDSTVSPDQRKQLTSELAGLEASIFYTFPVENGCWWLPALRHGQDCHGAPAFRRSEFPFELERILKDPTQA
jgi:hypothetical protein